MPDFKSRLVAERDDLADKLEKLDGFLAGNNKHGASDLQIELLNIQSAAMHTYLNCLNTRLKNL